MKKTIIICVAAAMAFAGCAKEQDFSGYATIDQLNELQHQIENQQTTQVYNFSVTFPAIQNDYYSQVQYNGLKGKVKPTDALLIYASIFGAWAQLPYCQSNWSITYFRADDGTLYFRNGLANYVQTSMDAENIPMRAIVIPQNLYSKMMSNGVDMTSCDAVVNACQKYSIE